MSATPDTTYPAYRGLRFEEDIALEKMLADVTVPNARGNPLKVAVIYRDPEREESKVSYPYFLIDFLGIFPRRDEEHRGIVQYGMQAYTGDWLTSDPSERVSAYGEFPIPITLRYQVSITSRVQQHDVILNDMAATTFFPIRYGQLTTPSGTVRRLDFEGMQPADSIAADNQRLYRKIWTIAISAEIVPTQWTSAPVTEVDITVSNKDTGAADPTIVTKPS